ncbi:hypothetical protein ACFPA8_16150 [Streptomyces ovatisporus]|uniref:Uncharacterized protein n=1 Tax=Streptomyces ovatisporus TaxID=1128682 RepID=A0ABV9A9S8_9ACTN
MPSTDYEDTDARRIDPAPLAHLLASWSSTGDGSPVADERARLLAEDEHDGPVHLVRLVAAIESAARQTGGSLARLTDTPAVTATCGGTLHHLVEVLHGGGLRAATAAARTLDSHSRYLILTALRPYWHAPLRALSRRLHDADVMPPRSPWRS